MFLTPLEAPSFLSQLIIPLVTFLTPSAEYSPDLKDRWAMLSQFVFVLKMRIKQAFPRTLASSFNRCAAPAKLLT